MKNKKLLGLLGVTTLLVGGLFINSSVNPVHAATPSKLYLKPNSNWKVDNARFAAYFFGNDEKWLSMTYNSAQAAYEVATPSGYPSVIFCRMSPSATANNWNNKWNQTSDLTVPTNGTNCYTVKEGTWDKGGGSWSTITEADPTYTVTYYDGTTKVGEAKDVVKGSTFDYKFFEKEGYRLEGWYKESSFTNKLTKDDQITANTSAYAKYVAAKDYDLYFEESETFGETINVYLWGEAFSTIEPNATWPGQAITKCENGKYKITVDAEKSYDSLIVNNGTIQTINLSLSSFNPNDTIVLGDKDAEGKYAASALDFNKLVENYYNKGTYTKATKININETKVGEDLSKRFPDQGYADLFHGSKLLERTTYYRGNALWMLNEAGKYSYYGTDSTGKHLTNARVDTVEETSDAIALKDVGGMEGYYSTLLDIFESLNTLTWKFENGVHTADVVVDKDDSEELAAAKKQMATYFLDFTAPCFYNAFSKERLSNYFTLTSVSIQDTADGLLLQLIASGDSGKLVNETTVLSQAIITAK